ncbi:MAG: lipopolysaccharide kinase InaA family protein, partial [Halioglobus sp.]
YSIGRGRALHSHRAAGNLRREGVSVPEPLGVLRLPEGMVLLSEAIPGNGNLLQVWREGPSKEEGGRILQVAGHVLGHLHTTGFAHGDCKWNNILWDGNGISLVDLDAVCKAELHSARQARDIARFTVYAEEMGVDAEQFNLFLESYLQVLGATRQRVVETMVPFVYSIRAKHLARYGHHGSRLV